MQLLAVNPSLFPMPASLGQAAICLVHCVSPGLTELWCSLGFLGSQVIISVSLADPLCTFLPRLA